MSHFSVLVVGDDLDTVLQPFHEFECTGVDDQYIQEVDETDEMRAEYLKATDKRIKSPDGALHLRFTPEGNYDRRWWVGEHHDARLVLPEGHEEIEVLCKDHQTFLEWVQDYTGRAVLPEGNEKTEDHKYGYIVANNGKVQRVIDRTNPNKKWDWWVVGGRYADKLVLTNGSRADTAMVSEVDWTFMTTCHRIDAAARYRRVTEAVAGRPVTTWKEFYAKAEAGEMTVAQAREEYHGQQALKDAKATGQLDFWGDAELFHDIMRAPSEDAYADYTGRLNATTWAMVYDGKWIERGEMGWFGFSDATDQSKTDYVSLFLDIIRSLQPTTRVTVVDCHI